MSIINLAIFLGIVIFALMTSSYLAGLILVFALSILEIVEYGMTHFMFLLMCELTLALFIIRETKLRKDNSPLLKYNPLYKIMCCREKSSTLSVAFFCLHLWCGSLRSSIQPKWILAANLKQSTKGVPTHS